MRSALGRVEKESPGAYQKPGVAGTEECWIKQVGRGGRGPGVRRCMHGRGKVSSDEPSERTAGVGDLRLGIGKSKPPR